MSVISKMVETQNFGTDFWNDSCDLSELRQAVEAGAVGATSNPVIVATAIEKNKDEWYPLIDQLISAHPDANEDDIAWQLIAKLGEKAAKILEPVFQRTKGEKGKLSLQVSPLHYRSSLKMVEHAESLASLAPNIAIKLPAIESGIEAMQELTAKGISINATVSFSVAQAVACAEAVERGLEKAGSTGQHGPITPYITLMVGRIDDHIGQLMASRSPLMEPGLIHWAGVAVFKKAYQIFRQRGYRARLLAAAYRHHLHWTEFVGGDVVLSMPYKWWNNFNRADLELSPKMGLPLDDRIIHQLTKHFSEFTQAYEEKGMAIQDFQNYGATRQTLNQFMSGLDELRRIVRARMIFCS